MKHRPLEITTLSVDVGFNDELNAAFNTLNSVRDEKVSHTAHNTPIFHLKRRFNWGPCVTITKIRCSTYHPH